MAVLFPTWFSFKHTVFLLFLFVAPFCWKKGSLRTQKVALEEAQGFARLLIKENSHRATTRATRPTQCLQRATFKGSDCALCHSESESRHKRERSNSSNVRRGAASVHFRKRRSENVARKQGSPSRPFRASLRSRNERPAPRHHDLDTVPYYYSFAALHVRLQA